MAGAAALAGAAGATSQTGDGEGERTPPVTSPASVVAAPTAAAPAAAVDGERKEEEKDADPSVAATAAAAVLARPNSQPTSLDGAEDEDDEEEEGEGDDSGSGSDRGPSPLPGDDGTGGLRQRRTRQRRQNSTEEDVRGLVHEISQSYPPGHHRDPSAEEGNGVGVLTAAAGGAAEAPSSPAPTTPTPAPMEPPTLLLSPQGPPPTTPGRKQAGETWLAYLAAWLWWGWRWAYEYVCEIAWDIVYVGYWVLTPFVGGLPPIREGRVAGKPPVVIVPGFCGRPRPFTRMRDRIAALGHPVYVFESGWQWGSIVDKSLLLAAENLQDVIIVGHSMGGLVSAEAMIRGEPRIKRMIAVGVPFHGSYFALTGLFIILWLLSKLQSTATALGLLMALLCVPSTRQMLPGSDLICCLRPRYPEIAHKVTCIYAPFDNILLLGHSALLLPDAPSPPIATATTASLANGTGPGKGGGVAIAETTNGRGKTPTPPPPAASNRRPPVVCDRFGHAHLLFGDGAHDLIVEELLVEEEEEDVVLSFGESM